MNDAPAKDRTGCIVFLAVIGAFLLLIGAWVFFFWIAGHNRIESVPTEERKSPAPVQPPAESRESVRGGGATGGGQGQSATVEGTRFSVTRSMAAERRSVVSAAEETPAAGTVFYAAANCWDAC